MSTTVELSRINPDILIQLVKSQKPIWNKNTREYSVRDSVDASWKRISNKMGVSEYLLRKKWKYLREQFRVEAGKVSAGLVPKWSRYDRMKFLLGFVKPQEYVKPGNKKGESRCSLRIDQVKSFRVLDDNGTSDSLVETYIYANDQIEDPLSSECSQSVDPPSDDYTHWVDPVKSECSQLVDLINDDEPTVSRLSPVSTKGQGVDPLVSEENMPVNTLANVFDQLEDPLSCVENYALDSLSDSSNHDSSTSRKRSAEREVDPLAPTSDTLTELVDDTDEAVESNLPKKKKPKTDDDEDSNDDMLFFRSLLPYVSKIEKHRKLHFRHQILQIVEEFAYPTNE